MLSQKLPDRSQLAGDFASEVKIYEPDARGSIKVETNLEAKTWLQSYWVILICGFPGGFYLSYEIYLQ